MAWITLMVVALMAVAWVAGGLLLRVVADPRPARAGRGTARRVVSILVVGALAAGAITLFAPTRHVSTPPRAEVKLATLRSPRTLQQHAAQSAVDAAAKAGKKALLAEEMANKTEFIAATLPGTDGGEQPAADAKPGVAIRIARVKSTLPHLTPERATADALEKAQKELVVKLRAMDPPVVVVPSVEVIRRDYVRPGSVRDVLPTPQIKEDWRNDGLGEGRQWTELDVEVSDSQLRALRAQQRTADGGLVAGTALAAFAALFGFLRLDGLTKGYLTTTLAFGAAAVVGGAVALLAWVR
jgi:hypothetical protein